MNSSIYMYKYVKWDRNDKFNKWSDNTYKECSNIMKCNSRKCNELKEIHIYIYSEMSMNKYIHIEIVNSIRCSMK